MADSSFCTACGEAIDPQRDLYCPKCGVPVKGGPADIQARAAYKEVTKRTATWAGVLLLIASIPSIIIGLDCIFNNYAIASGIWDIYSPVISFEALKQKISMIGIAILAIGVFGVIGAVLCFKHRFWVVALFAAIVLLIFGIFTLMGLFASLFAMWLLFAARDGFDEYSSKI